MDVWDLGQESIDLNGDFRVYRAGIDEDLGLFCCSTTFCPFKGLRDVVVNRANNVIRPKRGKGNIGEAGEFPWSINYFHFGISDFLISVIGALGELRYTDELWNIYLPVEVSRI
jgi:hypothetical protein